jgi:ribosomal protein S18 acetylase RimI-like enzyme
VLPGVPRLGAISIEGFAGDRRAVLLDLFREADDSESAIENYIDLGEVVIAREVDLVVGHVQFGPTEDPGASEIKSVAVLESHRRHGIGRALVQTALDRAAAAGRDRMIVATAAADIENLCFYQRLGFRMRSIERDAYTPERGYPAGTLVDGIELRDRVWLDRPLTSAP